MLSNLKIKKIGAYCGILSIFFSNIAVAMQPEPGVLVIHGKQSLQIVGHSQPLAIPEDISRLSYEDFDITAHLSEMPFPKGVHTWPGEKRKVESWHLDTNIPYIEGSTPAVDYDSLRAVPFFIAKFLSGKIHPSKQTGAKDFFEKIIVPNQQTLSSDVSEIPDLDCLYYKAVSGSQHLFLRLSSATRKEAEIFKQRSNGKTLFVESGELKLLSDGSMVLDHVDAEADKITVEAKDTIFNRASKMKAKWIIRLKAGKQRNETVINKWVRESSGKHHFAHAEGVESIDDCSFIAQEVVQEGDEVENYGIFVEADKFEDRAAHTVNMPTKITLINYAWEEDEDMFSSASSSVRQVDDVLVPTRYHVNYYRSASDTGGSSVKFGYTIINSGSKIEVLKDTKEDIVVDEQHTIEIHEEKSGFSIYGGVSVPDPTSHLQRLRAMHNSGNMVGLTTATISAVAKGIQAYEDYKVAETLLNYKSAWNIEQTTALLQTLSHYVHGPSIQFGSRSVDMKQQTILTHGNTFVSPTQIFHNPIRSSFAGTYLAKDMDIKTKTFITFDLPQTVHSEMSMHQSGISMDLLSFAIALINPAVGSALDAALSASSVTVGFQKGESHQTAHRPTILQAEHKLDIEAENGQLTQAQIKAGIIHAIFTNDLVLKTLANEKWTRKRGGSMSFGLGGLADFKSLADTLQNTVASANISHIDSGSFEKIIDDFASMVGEEEFYLRVGGILRTESAFVGHKAHDPAHEHIEAKERQDVKVEERHESYDHSFDLSVGDLMTVVNTLKQQIKDEAIADGLTQEEAEQIAKDSETALKEASCTVKNTDTTLQEIDEHTKADIQEKIIEVPDDAPVAVKRQAQRENLNVLSSSVRSAAQQKIRVLNQEIAAIEAQKTAMSEKIQQTPGVKETVTTVFDSMLDGLKSARDYCTYVVHNPLEAIECAYNVTTALGGMVVDKTTDVAKFVWNHPSEALDLTTAKFSAMYNSAKDDIFGTSFDAAEYVPFGIGSLVEGSRDVHGIWFAKDRDLRSVTDKWRNYGLIGAICGKGGKKVAKEVVEVVSKNPGKIVSRKIGQAGKYKDLIKGKSFKDEMQAHHMPSQRYLKAHDMDIKEGFSAMMSAEQHVNTRTYGRRANKLSLDNSYRSELAIDLNDYIKVLKADGSWTPEVRRSLMQGLDNFRKEFPDLFKKVSK